MIMQRLGEHGASVYMYRDFHGFVEGMLGEKVQVDGFFKTSKDLDGDEKVMLSVGGDGTFLEAVTIVRHHPIPIAGINSGRLGFLADISQEDINNAIDAIFSGFYTIEERSMVQLNTSEPLFGGFNIGLNEITVHKRDDSSMITIHAHLDGEYLNSYWADGLIVSTPTGSTAYSLSVGGPLLLPGANDFILAPIAPHNLNVRPLIYPDNKVLSLRMDGRGGKILVSMDSRSVVVDSSIELRVVKAPFSVKTLRLGEHQFYNTLRSKLMWGADKRN